MDSSNSTNFLVVIPIRSEDAITMLKDYISDSDAFGHLANGDVNYYTVSAANGNPEIRYMVIEFNCNYSDFAYIMGDLEKFMRMDPAATYELSQIDGKYHELFV